MELNLDYYLIYTMMSFILFQQKPYEVEFLLVCYQIINLIHRTTRTLFIGYYEPVQRELSSEIHSRSFNKKHIL